MEYIPAWYNGTMLVLKCLVRLRRKRGIQAKEALRILAQEERRGEKIVIQQEHLEHPDLLMHDTLFSLDNFPTGLRSVRLEFFYGKTNNR